MPLVTTTVQCDVTPPNGVELDLSAGARLSFKLDRSDVDLATSEVVPSLEVFVELDVDGQGDIELWPNARGEGYQSPTTGTRYAVALYAVARVNQRLQPVKIALGNIQVPEIGPVALAELLAVGAVDLPGVIVTVLTQAEYNAVIAAEAAVLAATAQTFDDLPALLAYTGAGFGVGSIWRTAAEGFSYEQVASGGDIVVSGINLRVLPGAGGRAAIEAFGCRLDGVTDDTAAFQAAFDSGLPLSSGQGEMLITDTILLDPGADFVGAGGVAAYDAAALRIRFEPATKRDVFNWRTPPTGVNYVFEGARLEGFTIRGFGPGASACLDLAGVFNGRFDFFAFAGIDVWCRIRRWIDSELRGGVQGFRAWGVEFSGAGVDPSDVTTTTSIDAYVSQGPIAYLATSRAVTDCRISGIIESVDKATDIARGNVLYFDIYTENVPRTDTGSAWEYGKTGVSPASETALHLNLRPGIGHSGGTLNNANLLDVDHVRYVRLSGYAYLYATLMKTTANTRRVAIVGLDTDNIASFSTATGVADFAAISAFGFNPSSMERIPGAGFFDGSAITPNLEFWPRTRATVTVGQMFRDGDFGGKIRYRDEFGNFSDPIPRLAVSGNSGWTVQGGRLTPGETVRNSLVNSGEVGLWQSMRHSRDAPEVVTGCSTTASSAVVTASAGDFDDIDVGDWVTVSDGFFSNTVQFRVIAKASNGSSVTLDTSASSTVAGTVTVATEAHQLVPMTQQGFRSFGADPTGVLLPKFLGEDMFRSDNATWYRSTGLTTADWKLLT